MYKLGITKPGDLARPTTLFGRKRPVSFSLLKTSNSPSSSEIARFESVIKTAGLASGVSKTTYGERLNDVDTYAIRVMKDIYSLDSQLEIHDMGVSDAVLSMKWAQQLFSLFLRARFTASDKVLYFTEAVWAASGETYILEPDGTPIQYTNRSFVIWLPRPEHPVYVLNSVVRRWALRHIARLKASAKEVSWRSVPDTSVVEHKGWHFRQIPLVHPKVLSTRNERFRVVEADAFLPSRFKYDVIRAMNLFQKNIFPTEKLRIGINSVFSSLSEGGLFILGKTVESEGARNDVSIFQKMSGRFVLIEKIGMGSELESLVL